MCVQLQLWFKCNINIWDGVERISLMRDNIDSTNISYLKYSFVVVSCNFNVSLFFFLNIDWISSLFFLCIVITQNSFFFKLAIVKREVGWKLVFVLCVDTVPFDCIWRYLFNYLDRDPSQILLIHLLRH